MNINECEDTNSCKNYNNNQSEFESIDFNESQIEISPSDLLEVPEFKNLDINTLSQVAECLNEYSLLITIFCSYHKNINN